LPVSQFTSLPVEKNTRNTGFKVQVASKENTKSVCRLASLPVKKNTKIQEKEIKSPTPVGQASRLSILLF